MILGPLEQETATHFSILAWEIPWTEEPDRLQSTGSQALDMLLGRKGMTNVDSILKSRDITLLTKVHIVKATVFPVVMYRCESWTIKKGTNELMLSNYGAGEDS